MKLICVLQEGASENVTILLAGNKCDHAERQVNTEKAEALAKVLIRGVCFLAHL